MQILQQAISISELKELAQNTFGDMIKCVADVKRGLLAVDADIDFFHNLHCFFSGQWTVDPSPTNLIASKDILIQVLDQRAGRGKKDTRVLPICNN